jgi:hypothetical protein
LRIRTRALLGGYNGQSGVANLNYGGSEVARPVNEPSRAASGTTPDEHGGPDRPRAHDQPRSGARANTERTTGTNHPKNDIDISDKNWKASITIAADTYTSVLPELAKQSAEDAAAILINATNKTRTTAKQ